jgi:hypothetical protein
VAYQTTELWHRAGGERDGNSLFLDDGHRIRKTIILNSSNIMKSILKLWVVVTQWSQCKYVGELSSQSDEYFFDGWKR